MIGTNLAHFKITAKIGEGGMGAVYRAEDTKLGRDVAIKVLPEEMAKDPERLERFQREARTLATVDHPNIVSIYSVEEVDGRHFLTMGLVDGAPLDQSIAAGEMSLSQIFDLAIPLVEAIAAAHEKDIVHRDLKPANVMVTPEGRVVVLDFGLAKLAETVEVDEMTALATEALTQEGVVMETVPYMSPEQIEGKPVDPRTDIFSLGVLLYEMAAGQRPFQGDSSPALMSSIMKDAPKSVVEIRSDLPRHLGRILGRCLEKSPDGRYQSAKGLLADLKNLKKETESSSAISSATPQPSTAYRRPWLGISVGLAVLIGIAAGGWFLYPRGGDQIDSLAVLPFENSSGDPETEYFSDGVTETIISSLSQLPDMKVISRTSAFHYKGKQVDPQVVGQELGVEALVLGHIIQRGDDLIVSTELVRVSDSGQIWGERYERQAADIFDIQREIARQISTALEIELTSDEQERVTRQHTENSAAYEAYLKGRQAWNLRTETGFRQAIENFQQAITADPTYALAYSGLADSYSLLGFYALPPREVLPQAQAAAERALDLDESLAEAHTSLAWIKMMYDWDLEGSRHEFERAFELNPSYATMLHWYSILLMLQDQPSAAVERIRTAFELDPLSRIINTEYVLITALAGRFEESGTHFEIARNLDPDFGPLYTRHGWSLTLQGRYAEAAEAFEEAVRLLGGVPYGLGRLGHAYAKAGRTDEAHEIIRRLEELSQKVYVSPIRFAFVYAGLGDLDHTFEWFEKAYEERTGEMVMLDFGPGSDLADDPRLADLRQRIGF